MPVTKKKGAIFAIYSDSPIQSQPHSNSSNTVRANNSVKSPTRRSVSTNGNRKALSLVQTSLGSRSSSALPETDKGKNKLIDDGDRVEKPLTKDVITRSSNQVSSRATKKPATTTTMTSKTIPSKRQFEIFSESSPSIHKSTTKTTTSASHLPGEPEPKPPSVSSRVNNEEGKSNQLSTIQTPTKKFRSSPRFQRQSQSQPLNKISTTTPNKLKPITTTEDKENQPPQLSTRSTSQIEELNPDSPASRTRSRSRISRPSTTQRNRTMRPGSISSIAQLIVDSPIRRSTRINGPVSNGIELQPSLPDNNMLDNKFDGLTGDGRGTLSFRKGRNVALVLDQAFNLSSSSDENQLKSEFNYKTLKKGVEVMGDGPLADVSEAYGASGVEPSGFKDQ